MSDFVGLVDLAVPSGRQVVVAGPHGLCGYGSSHVRRITSTAKDHQHVCREQAEGMWKDLVREGWKKVTAVLESDAEP